MGDRILIAYASKCGSTGEVAQAIGQVLCDAGATVNVRRVQDVKDLGPCRECRTEPQAKRSFLG